MRVNLLLTVTAGTPQQISSLLNFNTKLKHGAPCFASRVFIQMVIGGTGVGYVMDGIPEGTTPAYNTAGDLTAELAAATSTAPGGSYSDFTNGNNDGPGIDLAALWVDGSHTGDTIIVSAWIRI